MKKLVPVLLMMVTATGVNAQTSKLSFSKNPEHRAKVIEQATKGANKPTAVYYRISASSNYYFDQDEMKTLMNDSGSYKYANGRGSFVDFDELELIDYGLESTLSYDTAWKYDGTGGSPLHTNRYTATYNAGNKMTGFTVANHQVAQTYLNNSEEKAVFNANGDITTRTYSTWNSSQNKWEPSFVTEYKYNGQNKLVYDSSYSISAGPASVGHYSFDGNGNVISALQLQWQGSGWDSSRVTNTYYNNNKLKTTIEELYNADSARWEYSYFDTIGYTAGGDLEYRLYKEWDSASANWINTELETRTYNGGKASKLSFFTWDDVNTTWEQMIEADVFNAPHGEISKVVAYLFAGGVKFPIPIFTQNLYYEEYYNVSVKDAPKSGNITVYPNPASSVVNIALGDMQQAQVQMLNMSGQVVRSVNAANQQVVQLNTSGLPAGNYLLNISSANGAPARQIVTIQ